MMTKTPKAEETKVVPFTVETPTGTGSVEADITRSTEPHSDQLLPTKESGERKVAGASSRLFRRSRRAGRRYRVGRIHKLRISRRSTIPPILSANYVGTTDKRGDQHAAIPPTVPANGVPATDTTVESELSRQFLTAQFQTWNEKSVEGTVQKGRIIKQGQERLDKEEWKAWVVEDLHLTLWSAGLYVHISEHTILSDPKYWKYLPVDYRSLYELSQIDDDKLLEKITKREVHHDLGRSESVKLKLDSSGKPSKKPLPLLNVPDELAVLQKITRYFRPDNVWQAYVRQNPRPSELPSKEDIEAALRWVEMKRGQMRGKRGLATMARSTSLSQLLLRTERKLCWLLPTHYSLVFANAS
jgi:hypothetical protein